MHDYVTDDMLTRMFARRGRSEMGARNFEKYDRSEYEPDVRSHSFTVVK